MHKSCKCTATCVALIALALFGAFVVAANAAPQAPIDESSSLSSSSSADSLSKQLNAQSLASRLLPAKLRAPRSLGDMLEKVKNRIFSKKAAAPANSAQASNVANAPLQQQSVAAAVGGNPQMAGSQLTPNLKPWADFNANQFAGLQGFQQWPAQQQQSNVGPLNNNGVRSQFALGSSYNPFAYLNGGQPSGGLNVAPDASFSGNIPAIANLDGSPVQPASLNSGVAPSQAPSSAGGLLSSASQLFTQYLNPNGASNAQQQQQAAAGGAANNNNNGPQQQQLSPQQQQQQQSYNEFSSLLDSMVAQGGLQRPSQQQQQQTQMAAIAPNQHQQQQAAPGVDQEMSASSANVPSYLQASGQQVPNGAGPQQQQQMQADASQKSSMVSLAEQLAPGAQFNKLVSFPFSLSNNDDPSKEGRFKLHIPFVNQHVKRSDSAQQQQQQPSQAAQLHSSASQIANNNQNLAALSAAQRPFASPAYYQQQQQQQQQVQSQSQPQQQQQSAVAPVAQAAVAASVPQRNAWSSELSPSAMSVSSSSSVSAAAASNKLTPISPHPDSASPSAAAASQSQQSQQ